MSAQPDLFEQPTRRPDVRTPASRATDPQTSHIAEGAITGSGQRRTHQALVLDAVRARPGSTCAEIAQSLGLHRSVVSKRLPELKGEFLRAGEPRACSVARTKQVTWWPL